MCKRILLRYDGSECGQQALRTAERWRSGAGPSGLSVSSG